MWWQYRTVTCQRSCCTPASTPPAWLLNRYVPWTATVFSNWNTRWKRSLRRRTGSSFIWFRRAEAVAMSARVGPVWLSSLLGAKLTLSWPTIIWGWRRIIGSILPLKIFLIWCKSVPNLFFSLITLIKYKPLKKWDWK